MQPAHSAGQIISWGNTFEEGRRRALYKAFEKFFHAAEGVLKHYAGDLFNDARWLRENIALEGSDYFYWAVEDTGTSIGRDRDLVGMRKNLYLVTITYDKAQAKWWLNFEPIILVKGLTEDEAIDAGLVPPR